MKSTTTTRGNTLVLVTAILVLLVIIATAFLVRAQSGRAQAAAQQKATGREARVESVAADVAQEVANALFVKRIDSSSMTAPAVGQIAANQATGLTGQPAFGEFMARSDFPRLPAEPLAIRYGVDYFDSVSNLDFTSVAGGDGYLDGYNFAPFSVNPFTNWPERYGLITGEGNPIGNPGFGDTRWLASTEPVRAMLLTQLQNPVAPAPPNPQVPLPFNANWGNLALSNDGAPILSPEGLGFSHWPHMSWIPTAENGFRLCWNISNVESNWDHKVATATAAADRWAAGELNLGTPYEQWLPFVAPREPLVTGKDARGYLLLDSGDWQARVNDWFNVGTTNFNTVPPHAQIIKGLNAAGASFPVRRLDALPNFLQLGAFGDPSDEFKQILFNNTYVPTSRNLIGRTLADADGDGWTDSFWFVAPSSSDRSTRQLIAVRIMDNSALINVNTATRSDRGSTNGLTPSDVALVTRRESYDEGQAAGKAAAIGYSSQSLQLKGRDPWVGFFSARENDPEYRLNFTYWPVSTTTKDKLVYAVASDASGPTGGVDVAWAPERWEGRRTQLAAAGANAADPYQTGLLRDIGIIQEGSAGNVNSVVPFFDPSADFGLTGSTAVYGDSFVLSRAADRLSYFKAMANGGELVDPVTAARLVTLSPFGSDDEIELRAASGQNSPQTVSRLENALNSSASMYSTDILYGEFLRSTRSREESARFFDPDDVRVQDWRARAAWSTGAAFAPRGGAELLLDHRRMMTTISGARNELLPPRLWTVVDHSNPLNALRVRPAYLKRGVDFDFDGTPDDVTGDGAVTTADDLAPYHPNIMFPEAALIPAATSGFGIAIRDANGSNDADVGDFELARQRFLTDNRKIDLRRPNDVPAAGVVASPAQISGADRQFNFDLQRVMRRALIDEGSRQSYFGRPGESSEDTKVSLAATKMMIASFSANVLCYRDGKRRIPINNRDVYRDQPLHPVDAIAVPSDALLGTSGITDGRFIGVEKQPFIQEVFLAFVYPKSKVTQAELDAVLGPPGGNPLPGCPDPDNCSLNASDPYALPSCTADGAGEHFVTYDPDNPDTWPAVVFVVQIANPFNEPVNLADFKLRINPKPGAGAAVKEFFFGLPDVVGPTGNRSGNIYEQDVELGPCTPEEPRTAIVFALPERFPNGDAFPRDAWLDFLDIGASIDTDGDGTITPTEADPTNDVKPGQFFKPDINAIFSPAWGGSTAAGTQYFDANRRGGTLYFDATNTATYSRGFDVTGGINFWCPPDESTVLGSDSYIELRRVIYPSTGTTPTWTVVDRFENKLDPLLNGQAGQGFTDLIRRFTDSSEGLLPPPPAIVCRSGSLAIDGIRMQTGDYFVTWARGARQWLFDTQNGITPVVAGSGVITMDERTPRYAFARTTGAMASSATNGRGSVERDTYIGGTQAQGRPGEIITNATSLPDGDASGSAQSLWMSSVYYNVWGEQKRGKPSFFPTRIPESAQARTYKYPVWLVDNANLPAGILTLNYGEKGVSDPKFVNGADPSNFTAPYRLFQKDADFDQAAEILDVPLWGPLVQYTPSGGNPRTYATLAEILAQPQDSTAELLFPKFPKPLPSAGVLSYGSDQEHYNRLQLEPAQYDTVPSVGGRPTLLSGIQTMPPPIEGAVTSTTPAQQNGIGFNARLPGGAALLDAFVVDDRGAAPFDTWTSTTNPDGVIDFSERASAENRRLRLARNFEGKLTPGLININTAPIEVLHAMPQMTRLVYDDDFPITKTADSDPATLNAASSALSKRRLVRDPLAWQAAPYDMDVLAAGPGNPSSIRFDYGVAAPRVRVAEAMELWRNKGNVTPDLTTNQFQNMPSYFSRGLDLLPDTLNHREWAPGIRSERGFDSIGELAVLTKGAEFNPPISSDADGNGTPDVQDIAKGKVADVNRNNVADSADAAGFVGSSWNQVQGWSIRFAGIDPYRTKWDEIVPPPTTVPPAFRWGAGRNSRVSWPDPTSLLPPAHWTEGIPKSLATGQAQVYPLTGRTAIDKHLLVTATDDRATPAVNEINDPSNDSLGTQFIETKAYHYDMTSGDAVEQNQMLRGISNIVTTRSDVFTIWLRIRTIKQDTLTGQWNGTDPESIVDDSRYMMTIDRSSVDRPGEQPRIVSFVKVPN